MPKCGKKMLKFLGWTAVAVVAVLSVLAFYLFVGGFDTAKPVDDSALRIVLQDFPDEDNAFVALLDATNHYAVSRDGSVELDDRMFVVGYGIAFTNGNRCASAARLMPDAGERADRLLASNAACIAAVEDAVSRRGYRCTIKPTSRLGNIAFSTLVKFADFAILLRLKAQRELERGDAEAAAGTTEVIHRLGDILTKFSDSSFAYSIGCSIRDMAYGKMSDIVALGQDTDEMLERFSRIAAEDDATAEEMRRRAVMVDYSRYVRGVEAISVEGLDEPTMDGLYFLAPARVDVAAFRCVIRWPGFARFALHRRATTAKLFDYAGNVLAEREAKAPISVPLCCLLPNCIGDGIVCLFAIDRGTTESAAGDDASARTHVRLVLAAAKWRRKNGGALPPTLDALVPDYLDAVPVDPSHKERPLSYDPETGVVSKGIVWKVVENDDESGAKAGNRTSLRKRLKDPFRIDGRPVGPIELP